VSEDEPVSVRPAQPADIPTILGLIRELAVYERASHEVMATEAHLRAALFGPVPAAHVLIAEHESGSHLETAGFALWFRNFSTWLGVPGIYLEDLFVRPALRGHGYGRALLAELARLCIEGGYGRLEWSVLDWNEPAIGFYRSLGAQAQDEWTVHRLTGSALRTLAGTARSPDRR
jgi:GNAT superfamily N-acetyltransferase